MVEEVIGPTDDAPLTIRLLLLTLALLVLDLDAADVAADAAAAASRPFRAKERPASAPPNPATVTRMMDSSVEKYGPSWLLLLGIVGIIAMSPVLSLEASRCCGAEGLLANACLPMPYAIVRRLSAVGCRRRALPEVSGYSLFYRRSIPPAKSSCRFLLLISSREIEETVSILNFFPPNRVCIHEVS